MKKIRLGILGFGNIGKVHADNIIGGKCPSVELSAICDLKEARLEEAKEKAPSAKLFTSYEEMLKSGEIDSVLIAVPHYDHPKFAIMAMQNGIHTLVEKPAGVYTKQVKEMNEIAKGCDVVFGLMMNQRTNCIYRKMREIVKSGELGEIRRTNLIITDWYRPQIYYNSGDWRATWSGEGGGVLLNQCPHNLDLWQWICGMPSKIEAKLHFGKWHDIEVEDDVSAYCEYPNGATGVFVTTTGDTPGTNRFEITFEKGKLLAENNKLTMWKNVMSEPEFSRTNDNPFARPDFEVIDVETDGENPQHSGVLNAFADAILNGGELIARGEEGINGLTISNAMHLSAWTGKAVDLTNFDDELFYKELSKRIKSSKRKTEVVEVGTVDMNSSFVKDHYHTK